MLCQKIFYDKFTIVSSDKESDYMRIGIIKDYQLYSTSEIL